MAIFRLKEIREMSRMEREKKLEQLYAELAQQRVSVASGGAIENPSRIRLLRRTIARFLTVNREEELEKSRTTNE
ncbi:MAG: 50S ribosomal protein L29 [Candidatus Odinarchaeia archaeon]